MTSDRQDDLHWDAFRYVSGALTDPECAYFEARLDRDQAAREAVAEAVTLVAILARTDPQTIPLVSPPRHVPRRVLTWVASGVAASVLLVVASRVLAPGPEAGSATASASASRAVALTWSNLLQDEDPLALLDDAPGATEFDAVALAGADDRGLPGWLVEAAVIHQSAPHAASERREN